MDKPVFQLNKVKRLIKTQGQKIVFVRNAKNEFGEPNDEIVSRIEVTGVYHETTEGYLNKSTEQSTTLRKKVSPMFLCLWEEAKNLLHTDETQFNGNTYKINEIRNIGEAGIVADISLEEVQDG